MILVPAASFFRIQFIADTYNSARFLISKMAARKPEVVIIIERDEISAKSQIMFPCFGGRSIQRTLGLRRDLQLSPTLENQDGRL